MSNRRIEVSLNWPELVKFVEANKNRLWKDKYFSITLWPNDTPDQFGNDYSAKPRANKDDITKRTRLPFVGSAKISESGGGSQRRAPQEDEPPYNARATQQVQEDDDTPPF